MRIVMVSARYLPLVGGIETHIHEVGIRMAALGHAVTVLTTDPTGRLEAQQDIDGLRVIRVPARPKNRDYYFSLGIARRLLRDSWDVIHFQGYNTFVAPIGLLAAVRGQTPFVLTFHSGGHSSSLRKAVRPLQHAILRPLIRRASQLIAVSEFEAEFFSARMRLDRERFVVVPNGAWLPQPSANKQPEGFVAPNGEHLIVSVGRLERYKGHHRVIKAFPELLRLVPNARLRIVGSGPYEQSLRDLAQRLGIARFVRIEAVPSSDRVQLANLLSSAGLVVLLSEYEAHPVAIMEALSLGRPTLVSDTTGLRELAQRGLCRSVPLAETPRGVAAAMAEALDAMPATGQLALPDWDACTRQLLGIYRGVVNRFRKDAGPVASCGFNAAQPEL
jgi:glycosyltransferase involved in cell wall biosynthesis